MDGCDPVGQWSAYLCSQEQIIGLASIPVALACFSHNYHEHKGNSANQKGKASPNELNEIKKEVIIIANQ